MKSAFQHTPQIGSVVECIYNDKIIIAVIEDIRSSSLYLYTSTNREIKVNENRVLPWIGPVIPKHLSRNEYIHVLQQTLITREEIKTTLDIQELWECIVDEIQKATVYDLAHLLVTDPSSDFIAGLGRALLEHKAELIQTVLRNLDIPVNFLTGLCPVGTAYIIDKRFYGIIRRDL